LGIAGPARRKRPPGFHRVLTFGARVAAIALLAIVLTPPAKAATKHSSFARQLLGGLNEIRAAHGLAPLDASHSLTVAATQHNLEMWRYGFFSHDSESGAPFWVRIEHWYPPGHRYWAVGENILWNSPGIGPQTALSLWMHSPEHRANILNPAWRDVGISVDHFASAPATFGGGPTTLVTTDFGVGG
jgi:uncharacterized protein YkwD